MGGAVLVLGGTQFIGHRIVQRLLQAGHAVTVLNRGRSADDLPPEVERRRGDRDLGPAGLVALQGRRWDACIDVSGYTAVHLRASTALLEPHVERYIYLSAVSVYGDPAAGPVNEATPLVDAAPEGITEVVGDAYGRLKVSCERIVQSAFGGRAAVLRPQVVVGKRDPLARLGQWVHRATLPGPMLAPGDGSDWLQVVDVDDLARFAVQLVAGRSCGVFNIAGPRVRWADFIGLLRPPRVVWVPAAVLREAGLTYNELPLYRERGGPRSSLMDVSSAAAQAAGFTLTPFADTVARVRDAVRSSPPPCGLAPALESQLIARAQGAG